MNLKLKKDFLNIGLLILIIFISFLTDQYFLKNNSNLHAWDQGYHLTNLFKTYNIFEEFNLFNENINLRPTIETVNLISDVLNFKFDAVINKFFYLI